MIPQSDFNYVISGSTVTFTDTSTNTPTGWAWVFGDGNTSQTQNPVHAFETTGTWAVTLTVANNDGSSLTTKLVVITIGNSTSNLSIDDYVSYRIPKAVQTAKGFPGTMVPDLMAKWKAYIRTQLTPEVPLDDNNEEDFPILARVLIGDLIVIDMLTSIGTMALGTYGAASSKAANLKKVETGPSNAEWYNESEFWAQAFKPGGLLELLKGNVCAIASNLGVWLPFCNLNTKVSVQYVKAKGTIKNPVKDLFKKYGQ